MEQLLSWCWSQKHYIPPPAFAAGVTQYIHISSPLVQVQLPVAVGSARPCRTGLSYLKRRGMYTSRPNVANDLNPSELFPIINQLNQSNQCNQLNSFLVQPIKRLFSAALPLPAGSSSSMHRVPGARPCPLWCTQGPGSSLCSRGCTGSLRRRRTA